MQTVANCYLTAPPLLAYCWPPGVLGKSAWAAGAAAGKGAFEARSLADVVKALGYGAPVESKDVTITAPDIAENGAVVPLGASSTAAGVKQMMLLGGGRNPSVLAALFNVTPEVESSFKARVKMGQSSNVFAVVVTEDNKVLFAQKEVKVTLGGCRRLIRPQQPSCQQVLRFQRFSFQESTMADPMRIRRPSRWRQGHRSRFDGPRNGKRPTQGQRRQKHSRPGTSGEVTASLNGKVVMTAEWGPVRVQEPIPGVRHQRRQGRGQSGHQLD